MMPSVAVPPRVAIIAGVQPETHVCPGPKSR